MDNIVGMVSEYLPKRIVILVIVVAATVATTYQVINVLYIEPKNQEIQRQDKIIIELKEKIVNLKKDLTKINPPKVELPIPTVKLCGKNNAQIITINNTSLMLSIDNFWEKGTMVSLIVNSPSHLGEQKKTKAMKGGKTEKVVLHKTSYVLSVLDVEDPCVTISIEKIKENKS
jgi:hypothetical protein